MLTQADAIKQLAIAVARNQVITQAIKQERAQEATRVIDGILTLCQEARKSNKEAKTVIDGLLAELDAYRSGIGRITLTNVNG